MLFVLFLKESKVNTEMKKEDKEEKKITTYLANFKVLKKSTFKELKDVSCKFWVFFIF